MYTDRIKEYATSIAGVAIVQLALFTTVIADHPAYAQSRATPRLSSNPYDLRDAFVQHPANVNTPVKFARYLKQNDALLRRYARHFGVPKDKMVAFVQNALVPYTLPKPQRMTTFGVTKNGKIYPVSTRLPAGSKVWATREGVPVLKWNCTNPLSRRLPGTRLTPPLQTAYTPSPTTPISSSSLPAMPISGDSVDTISSPFSGDSVAVAPPISEAGAPIPLETVTSASLPVPNGITKPGGTDLSELWPALLVPLAFIHTGGSGHISGTSEGPPYGTPTVVPEMDTVYLLMIALPLVGSTLWRRGYLRRE